MPKRIKLLGDTVEVEASPGDIIDILVRLNSPKKDRKKASNKKKRPLLSARALKIKQKKEREEARLRKQRLRREREESGLCNRCGKRPPVKDRKMCTLCGANAAELNKASWAKRKLLENYT